MTRDYHSARNYDGSSASARWGCPSPSEVREKMYSRSTKYVAWAGGDPSMSMSEYRESRSGRY